MPSNEQRRETAKRKLERQLERREQKARRQRLAAIIGSVVAALVAIAVVVGLVWMNKSKESADGGDSSATASADTATADAGPTAAPPADGKLPPFTPSAALGANCQYPGDGAPAKPVNAPRTGKVPTDPAQVSASMSTSQGNIGLQLDNAKAPCR